MKKIVILLFVAVPGLVFSQIKPSITKADAALRAGKLDEAKTIIDATVGNQEFMVDKKGQPSKNAAKAWYLKGVIYFSMDTTKKVEFKTLEPNAFAVGKEAFEKAKEIDKGKSAFLITDKGGVMPMLYENVNAYFAQAYFTQAVSAYSEKKDYKKAFLLTEETLYFIPNDTSVIMNAGVYFGPAAEEFDKSIVYIKDYFAKGGKGLDAYTMLFSIYRDKMKDNEAALKVCHDGMVAFPHNTDFPRYELDLYIKMGRLPDARIAMQKQVDTHPDDKESRYFLGVINMELKDNEEAKKWYSESIKLDPKYFEPRLGLAEIIYEDAKKVKAQMNQLGISKEDTKKKLDLDKVYVTKLKESLPYWTDCEKLSPDDSKVLDILLGIYSDLDMQPEVARVTKKMKALGLLD